MHFKKVNVYSRPTGQALGRSPSPPRFLLCHHVPTETSPVPTYLIQFSYRPLPSPLPFLPQIRTHSSSICSAAATPDLRVLLQPAASLHSHAPTHARPTPRPLSSFFYPSCCKGGGCRSSRPWRCRFFKGGGRRMRAAFAGDEGHRELQPATHDATSIHFFCWNRRLRMLEPAVVHAGTGGDKCYIRS